MATQPISYNSFYDPDEEDDSQLQSLANPYAVTNAAPVGPYGGVYGNPVAAPAYNGTRDDSIGAQVSANQNYINEAGQQLNQEAQGELAYYGPMQQQYDQAQRQALESLNETPGYTPEEAGQINVDYSQYNTPQSALNAQFLTGDEQSAITGNPYAPADTMNQGVSNEGAQLNAYQQNLAGQVGNYANYTGSALSGLQSGTSGALSSLDEGLQDAQGGFSKLDTAVNNPALAFDPNNTEKQMTDQDVQDIKTAAGTRIGNQYKSAEDQLQRSAAAAGNTSPLAIAAANARLQSQEAADQGDSEANADIAARQAQYERASGIEAQREGATQTQAGMQAGAATTEQAQAQNAAALAGTQGVSNAQLVGQAGINAAENVGQAGINAANQYGQEAIGTQEQMTNQGYNAQANAEQQASNRAATVAQNRQTTQGNVNQAQYQQGTGSQQLTSQGAQTTGNARMAGQAAYRSGVQGQQQYGQTGGQNAMQSQQNAFATQTGGLNQGTSTLSSYKTGAPTFIGQTGSFLNAVGLEKGGVVTKPEIHIIGEKGPEMVVKMPRYRTKDREAA